MFTLKAPYQPSGDQPQAIDTLTRHLDSNFPHAVLLGVTGSGKTYTMANVIERLQRPTLVISHNKTLAAQLYQELRDFFPDNVVSYFVSYYDYYQPEAYLPQTDTYIEKETQINDEIDKLRLSSTTNLLTRSDSIVVASVSSIYNLGSPVEYGRFILPITQGQLIDRNDIVARLIDLQYSHSTTDLLRGTFRKKGETIQLWPAYTDYGLNLLFTEKTLAKLTAIDPLSGTALTQEQSTSNSLTFPLTKTIIYPAKHYITEPKSQKQAFQEIVTDLKTQLDHFKAAGKIVEAYRLEQKVKYDLEMIQEFGFVNGIENYSRYFDGRKPGDPPFTLIDYFHENCKLFNHKNFLTIIDESHITMPQIQGMHRGDKSRKQTLIDYGFRLPSALDNRPLTGDEFLSRIPSFTFVSATPGNWEIEYAHHQLAEQIIRPTGLLDPTIEIRPTQGQIQDLVLEILKRLKLNQRTLVTTLTKRMAEDLAEFLNDEAKLLSLFPDTASLVSLPKVAYLHSDIHTLDRSEILDDLRRGKYDVLIGINLLREGLDLPEVSLVAILNADHEGFLRSSTSLIQVMGRAARHHQGHCLMYADKITKSMQIAIDEGNRRRQIQKSYNDQHGITPQSIQKPIREVMVNRDTAISDSATGELDSDQTQINAESLTPMDLQKHLKDLTKQMKAAAKAMDFERAAALRDQINNLSQ